MVPLHTGVDGGLLGTSDMEHELSYECRAGAPRRRSSAPRSNTYDERDRPTCERARSPRPLRRPARQPEEATANPPTSASGARASAERGAGLEAQQPPRRNVRGAWRRSCEAMPEPVILPPAPKVLRDRPQFEA